MSYITDFRYRPEKETLTVWYGRRAISFWDVTQSDYEAFLSARNKTKYFEEVLKVSFISPDL